jgi:glycine cleavage system H lipoate-binding protein
MVLLLAVATLIVILGIGAYLVTREKRLARALAADESTGGIYFHPGHTWASFLPTGMAKVGIDRFLREVLGRFEDVLLPSAGRSVKQGQVVLTLIKGGRQVHVVSPLDGVVCATNPRSAEGPEFSFKDDYLLLVRPTRLKENMAQMKGYREADGWFRAELARFKDFITFRMGNLAEVGATLADGGEHMEGIVEKMDEATLKAFTEAFLR